MVATAPPIRLEILYSTRSSTDCLAVALELDGLLQVPCGEAAYERAWEVQQELAAAGAMRHRSVHIPDLVIAAIAELADATVWHDDEHFDRIARITGQPTEWIVPRGSI